MKIEFSPQVAITLETIVAEASHLEFSGFGFVNVEPNRLYVYDFVLLDIGSSGMTDIDAEDIVALIDREDAKNMRLWVHKHPIGNGVPGKHNWSITDANTIQNNPLGGPPQVIKWSASIVRTPKGWVGRIDNYYTNTTLHLPVEPAPLVSFDQIEQFHTRRIQKLKTLRDRFQYLPKVIHCGPRLFVSPNDNFDDWLDDWEDYDDIDTVEQYDFYYDEIEDHTYGPKPRRSNGSY